MTTHSPSLTKPIRLLVALLVTLAAALASAAAANATVYCVHDSACPAGGVAKDTLVAAVTAADADAAPDTVRLGAGAFSSPNVSPANPVDIRGAGMGATEVTHGAGSGSLIHLHNAASRVSDLAIRLTANNQEGIRLLDGADAENVKVTSPHNLTAQSGIMVEDPGSDIRSVVVDLGTSLQGYAIGDLGGDTTITDANLTAGIGILPDPGGTIVRRVTVRAVKPFFVLGGTLNVANALLMHHPDSPSFAAASVVNGNAGENALLHAADMTVLGAGNGDYGIEVYSNQSQSTGTATATLQGVIIRNVDYPITRDGASATETANVSVDHSSYDASKVQAGVGNGTFTVGAGNLTTGPDPKFVDPAAGDYRLRFDSPLLDKGPPIEPLSGDAPDLGGRSRVRDSDGNGSAVRDIGAFEYQRLAPSAGFGLQPAASTVGEVTSFDATGSDPDGDPFTFGWAFGDGATGSGAQASHVYGTPGSYQPTLTMTDASGLSATATRTATVAAPAGGNTQSPPPPVAPVLSGLSESARTWLAGTALSRVSRTPRRRLPVGTTFRFSLNMPATVRFVFTRTLSGRKVSGKCVRQTKRNRRKPACRRTVTAGGLRFRAHAGANRVRFQGRLSRTRKLTPGRYTLIATATNSAGQRSAPRRLTFRIGKPA